MFLTSSSADFMRSGRQFRIAGDLVLIRALALTRDAAGRLWRVEAASADRHQLRGILGVIGPRPHQACGQYFGLTTRPQLDAGPATVGAAWRHSHIRVDGGVDAAVRVGAPPGSIRR